LLHQIGVLRGPDEADQGLPFAHQRDFIGGGWSHLEHQVGLRPQSGGRVGHRSARSAVGVVGTIRGIARTRFDGDGKAQFDQFFDHLGHRGHALFSWKNFAWHTNALRDLN
jgi:hypothetical protein